MIPYLHFYVSRSRDKKYARKYFPMFKKIFGKDFDRMIKLSLEKRSKESLKKEMKKLKKAWKKRENLFFELTSKKFGPWKRKVYFCHVSSTYVCGGGYEYPTIIVFPFSQHVKPLDTIAHELLHLKVIEDVKRLNLKPKHWIEFSEIAVAWMTQKIKKDFNLSVCFPNSKIERRFRAIKQEMENISDWDNFLIQLEKLYSY